MCKLKFYCGSTLCSLYKLLPLSFVSTRFLLRNDNGKACVRALLYNKGFGFPFLVEKKSFSLTYNKLGVVG